MKKKLANLLLALIACLFVAFGFVACGENPLAVSAPTNVRVDAGTMAVTWDKVDGAAKYTISINDGTEYSITNTSYACSQLIQSQQTFTVKVCAVSSVGDMKSEATVMTFSPLDKITDLTLTEEGSLTWSVVNNATGYALRIDGVEQQVPLAVTEYAIETTGRHSYQVRPVGADNSFYSVWSDVQQVTKLGTVDTAKIKYDVQSGKLSWSAVSGATAYDVYVNGFIEVEDCKATSVDFDCPNANFVVEIKAKSTAQNTLAGETSEQKEFIFLDPVTNIRVEDGVLVWDEVNLATGYLLKIGNATPKTITGTSYDKLARGTSLTVSLMPVSTEAVYFSNWSSPMDFYLLEAPVIQWNSSLELDDGEAKNNIWWNAIERAHGYELKITAPNGDESMEEAGATDRDFAYAFLEVGTYTVELKATADPEDSTICSSPYSTAIKVTRLPSPTKTSTNFITSNAQELSKGFTVSFEKVAKAKGYRLYKEETQVDDTTSSTTQFSVGNVAESGVTSEKSYNYSIQALGDNIMQNNAVVLSSLKSKLLSFAVTVLATPQDPTIEGYLYKFGSIERANGYAVFTGAQAYGSKTNSFDLGAVLPEGNAEIKVCAKGNGAEVLASSFSTPINVHRLTRPYNIRIEENGANSVLTCAEITHAKSYNVVFDNNGQAMDVDSIDNVRDRITTKGTYVYMEAVRNEFGTDGTYYMTSPSSDTVTFVKLDTPTFGGQPFSNTQLTWRKPGNINESIYTPSYAVYDQNGIKYNETLTGTSMNIAYLDGGKDYSFKVKAIGDSGTNGFTRYISSDESEVVTVYKLASPEISIDMQKNEYQWSAVAKASAYQVLIDGENKGVYTHENNKTYTYKPNFKELKTYKVEIVALGDLTSSTTSLWTVNSKSVEGKNVKLQETNQLTEPDFALSYSHTTVHDQGKLTVTLTQESTYATGYSYTVGGTEHFSEEAVLTVDLSTPAQYKVSVYAQGGGFDENGVYYLDSQAKGGNSTAKYMMTLLAEPSSDDIEFGQDGTVEFAKSNTAEYGYTVQICINGGEWITVSENAGAILDVSKLLRDNDARTVKFRIWANGYGTNVIASKAVETQTWNWNNA